ncbi:MAG: YdcF family protein [Anaerolineales bacterium]|nr:YdcF family protein [Anaerolineales bacterium]MCB9172287.1 YdcF family protein [Ardenticatenales bacterium]
MRLRFILRRLRGLIGTFLRRLPWLLLLYLLITLVQVIVGIRRDEAAAADAIVVLGTAQYNGRPSSVLRARLDHAIALYHEGYAPRLITTGGGGLDAVFTEGGVGASYAMARGVPAEAILVEDNGATTWQSMLGVGILAEQNEIERVIVVSDPFHIARCKEMARAVGLDALGSPTRSSPISRRPSVELGYVMREVASLVIYRGVWLRDALWGAVG